MGISWGLFGLFERFGGSYSKALHDQLNLVKLAEELGFESVWIGEHHFNDFSICPSPSTLLGALVTSTHTIRLGTAGFLAPFYNPIRLAEEIALLDQLSCGRLNVGWAKGAFAPDFHHFHVDMNDLRQAMQETIRAVTLLLFSEEATFEGRFVSFQNVRIEPRPWQNPIPNFIATFASEESIRFAAENNFGLMASQSATVEECRWMSDLYESIQGSKPKMVIMRTLLIDPDDQRAKRRATVAADYFARAMRAASSFQKAPPWNPNLITELAREREAFFQGEKFVNAGIIGDAKRCRDLILEITSLIPEVQIAFKPAGVTYEENQHILRMFYEEVLCG
ncbi:MAG: LLM class flavin-dependent oxidoreductase [Campylobacterales bacterium]